jgi:hypothetical protein
MATKRPANDLSSDDLSTDDDDAPPDAPVAKKTKKPAQKRSQTYLPKYSLFPGILPSSRGESYAYCSYCRSDFLITHSGSGDIDKHRASKGHKKVEVSAKNTRPMTGYLGHGANKDQAVIRAEVMFAELATQLNWPIASNDLVTKTVKAAFPDSAIAKKYACGRSKATAIVKELAKDGKLEITDKIATAPFCLATDGSNDLRNKQFPVVINYTDLDVGVCCRLLSVPVLTNTAATGRFGKFI